MVYRLLNMYTNDAWTKTSACIFILNCKIHLISTNLDIKPGLTHFAHPTSAQCSILWYSSTDDPSVVDAAIDGCIVVLQRRYHKAMTNAITNTLDQLVSIEVNRVWIQDISNEKHLNYGLPFCDMLRAAAGLVDAPSLQLSSPVGCQQPRRRREVYACKRMQHKPRTLFNAMTFSEIEHHNVHLESQ